jgi:anti-anti-sigma regulatory factor
MTQDLLDTNAALERTVAQRTAELSSANAELTRELAERERAEAERAHLQEEILRAHAARLAELSTPVIPITDRITVIPLIGRMDEHRTKRLVEVALEQAHGRRSAVVILDVTGVKEVDTDFARTLAAVAGGLRLLGAEVVITGVSAAMAQALVELGADLPAMVTKGTLQSGFAYAVARVNAITRAGSRG